MAWMNNSRPPIYPARDSRPRRPVSARPPIRLIGKLCAAGRTERNHRRVGIRSAPDTMAVLSGYLPVDQGIACYAALRKHADATVASGDGRTRDQIMADTMVERLTGQTSALM